ncbi:MAG: PRC-barrel domain-containing protein [Chthoniobacter sp.]|uniref:PRC-barrel domain-containing protein n=1 Tax=Chthoniobacter sp. TaxID=2510640 RepID=UPI0032A69CBF
MIRKFKHLIGCALAAKDGEIGKLREMLFDDHSWSIRYLVVDAGSWLLGRDVLIAPTALGEIDEQASRIVAHLDKEQVRNSPPIESEKPVSRQYEERYYRHYAWAPYWVVPGTGAGMAMMPPLTVDEPEVSENLQPKVPPEDKGDPCLRSSGEVARYSIHAQDGELGHIEDFLFDDADWRIRYLVVDTRKWFPGKHVLVAPNWIQEISFETGKVFVNLPRSTIKAAPEYDDGAPISRAYEQRLVDHYGYKSYWDAVASK